MKIKTKKNIEQSKYLTDLKPAPPLVEKFTGDVYSVDAVQHKVPKVTFRAWWFRLWNKKVDNNWPNNWAKKGDIDQ